VALLLGAPVASVAAGGLVDAAVTLAVVAGNAGIGFATESSSERIIRCMTGPQNSTLSAVRDGIEAQIGQESLVPWPAIEIEYRPENRRHMRSFQGDPKKIRRLVTVKGDPHQVLKLCSNVLSEIGRILSLRDRDRRRIGATLDDLAGRAYRVLGFAYAKECPRSEPLAMFWFRSYDAEGAIYFIVQSHDPSHSINGSVSIHSGGAVFGAGRQAVHT
jgi:magnesium-transporting ATPase (P-type)